MLPGKIDAAIRAALVRALLGLIALVIALGGLWWIARAGFTALLEVMHPGWAASITGGGLLLLALLLSLPMILGGRSRRRPSRQPPAQTGTASATAAMAGAEVARAVRERPGTATLLALAAGLAVGYSPRLRRTLLDLLRQD